MSETENTSSELPTGLVLPYLILLRIVNALTIKTFFQADEYWQSLEPAHKLVFGYGFLTWEWRMGLRSFLHPLMFAGLYKIVDTFGLGDDFGVLILPKLFQAIIAAVGEYHLYRFAYSYTGNETIARWCLLISVTSAYNWYIITRTFSNSVELALTSIALSYWPWKPNHISWNKFNKSIFLAATCVIIKPTNVLIWIYLSGLFVINQSAQPCNILKFVLHGTVISALALILSAFVDYLYYGELVFPVLNFIKFNATSSLSKFYGIAPWHFHLTQSVPVMLLTYLPFGVYGFIKYPSFNLKGLALCVIGSLSLIDHKEFRFLYPIQPVLFIFTSYGLYYFNLHHSKLLKYSMYSIILMNTLISLFFTQVHERGVIDVIQYLRVDPDVESIGFLTPCHSTPWQSYLHNEHLDNTSWFLTCEPPLHLLNSSNSSLAVEQYMDESDVFYDDPEVWLYKNMPPVFNKELRTPGREYTHEWPTHLVIFEDLEELMVEYLKDSPYQECNRFFNTYFHWDSRRSGDIIVYCKWPWE